MSHVSKKKLHTDVHERMKSQLAASIVSLRTQDIGEQFMVELLTETEQIMLAKRLALVFMLAEGMPVHHIKRALRMSSSTVYRFLGKYENGHFVLITDRIASKQKRRKFWQDVVFLLELGLTPMGKDRWKPLDKVLERRSR